MQRINKLVLLLFIMLILGVSFNKYSHSNQQQYYDQTSDLVWQYCSSTQFKPCLEPVLLDWGQALRYCAQLDWSNYKDWRLASRNQLLSLVNRQKRTPAITGALADSTKDNVYWSSNTDIERPELAYYVSFFSGNSYANSKQAQAYVRCVR